MAIVIGFAVDPLAGVIVFLVETASFYFIYRMLIAPQVRRPALFQNGVAANARILDLADTGWTVNESPMVRLRLQVLPPGGEPYETELKTAINRLEIANFQVGKIIPVNYDPADPQNVAIGEDNTESLEDPDKKQQAGSFIARIDQENEEILAAGKAARAVILKSWELGINVNGNDPVMSFLLEVTPEGGSSFQSEATAVISEASIPQYQPGCSIYVKYDEKNLNRVGIDHS
jgi:hypothetical protein